MTNCEKKKTKKEAIFEAALKLIAENGFHGTSTAAIADKAGVGVGSIYRYFKNKDELILELFHCLKAKEREIVMYDPEANESLRDHYIRLNLQRIDYVVQNPMISRFFEQFFNSPYGLHHRRIALAESERKDNLNIPPIAQMLKAAVQQKIVKDLPLVVLISLTHGPIVFYLRDVHAGVIGYSKQVALKLIESTWDAIKI